MIIRGLNQPNPTNLHYPKQAKYKGTSRLQKKGPTHKVCVYLTHGK